jgi:hypothetical protein
MQSADAFREVYRQRLWGAGNGQKYYSGPGSHNHEITSPYVQSIKEFLSTLPFKADAVDLGCGDFNIGRQIRPQCNKYIACDVVEGLIEWNRQKFADQETDFRVLNIAAEPLPPGDVAFIRQVLQHMSNDQIRQLLPKLLQYKWVVITEHLPLHADYTPNLDKPAGPTIRVNFNSGVEIDKPPFNFSFHEKHTICSVNDALGKISTVAYRLN